MTDVVASPTLLGIVVGVGWFVVFVVVHVTAFHAVRIHPRFRATAMILGVATIAAVVTTLAWRGTDAADLGGLGAPASVVTIACLWVLYMPCYYVVATSVSVRTLLALAAADGTLSLAHLEARFASADMLKHRLAIMEAAGNIVASGERFTLTAKGRRTAAVFDSLKRLWRLAPGG